jgi:hypothetical protein
VWLLCLALAACQRPVPVADELELQWQSRGERRISLRDVEILPADNVRSAKLDVRGVLRIARVDQTRGLSVRAPNACPVSIAPGPAAVPLAWKPVLELGGDRTGIGYDTGFTIQVHHNCPEPQRGQVEWSQLQGAPLQLQTRDDGYVLSAKTARFEDAHPEPIAGGIVAISPRTQGRVVLEASWRGQTRSLTLTAAARSNGLSSVAVSQPIVLAGTGWQVKTHPPGGHAGLSSFAGLTFFAPDAIGRWTLSHEHDAEPLTIQALTHDATPYDCGRAECHAALSAHTTASPMSHALERPLEAAEDAAAVGCMLDCHVLGERGLSDGGFRAVAERLDFTWNEHTRWNDLPRALRRLGGVRCSACHGPGAIPPPEQRSAILQSDVCASCHDAPPRYVHVSQWRSGKMAVADRDPATRAPECAHCHTTAGFLAHNGVRKLSEDESPKPEPVGIACAACHAPHAADSGARLIRGVAQVAEPGGALFAEPSVELCRACHAPAAVGGTKLTAASAFGAMPASSPPLVVGPDTPPTASPIAPLAYGAPLGWPSPSTPDVEPSVTSAFGAAPLLPATRSQSPSASMLGSTAASTHMGSGGLAEVEPAEHTPNLTLASSLSVPSAKGPAAPSGALWSTQLAVPASDGTRWELIGARSVHQSVPRGCIGCHGGNALEHGAVDHSFRADARACASCHRDDALQAGRELTRALHARALSLAGSLAVACGGSAGPHTAIDPAQCIDASSSRAAYEVGVVLDDAAAAFHNADLARALLADAARLLSGSAAL